jgi:hypothetical protein
MNNFSKVQQNEKKLIYAKMVKVLQYGQFSKVIVLRQFEN